MEKKKLPYSSEAEASVLGCLLLDSSKWEEVNSIISCNDFYIKSNKVIFTCMSKLVHLKIPIDIVTVCDFLSKEKIIKIIGGVNYLVEISKHIVCISNILVYANLIKEYSISRKLISASNDIIEFVDKNSSLSSIELLDYAESKIININNKLSNRNDSVHGICNLIDNVVNNLSVMKNSPTQYLTGLDTGFSELNNKTLGFQKSELIIIAARPSLGKTTLALNICENISFLYDKPILIFSLEMSSEQIIMKIISSLSNIDLRKIRTGYLNDDEWKKISDVKSKIKMRNNIFIDDSSSLTPSELRSKSKNIFKKYGGLSLILVDYLQLMSVPNIGGNRTLEVSEISKSLKSLAKELQVPVLALSQLNRSLEQRFNKRPINSDLRDSGTIEQDADLIIFLHKEDFINNKINNVNYELIIGKQRNGPVGILKLLFNNRCSKFFDVLK